MTVLFQVVGEDEKWYARRAADFDDAAWQSCWGDRFVQYTNTEGVRILEVLGLLGADGDPVDPVSANDLAERCRRILADGVDDGIRRLLVFAEQVHGEEVKFG